MSQIQTTQDTNQQTSEDSLKEQTKGKSKYAKDDSDSVMIRVKTQAMKKLRYPDADDFIETSPKMVKFFAGDEDYKLNYVVVSGIKVYAEGTVDETEAKDSESISVRNNSF